jgi:hypothetical protein
MALSAELILKMLAAPCGSLPLGVEAEAECRCESAAQKKGLANFDEPGATHSNKRRTQHCLPETPRRQGCEGPGSARFTCLLDFRDGRPCHIPKCRTSASTKIVLAGQALQGRQRLAAAQD